MKQFEIRAIRQFKMIRPLLRNWIKVIKYFMKMTNEDLPWAYNERASLSLLAAAAWCSHGVAIEEFSTSKRVLIKGKKRLNRRNNERMGRCDLFVVPNQRGITFAVEAKQTNNIAIHPSRKAAKAVNRKLGEALADLKRLRPQEASYKLAVCFVSPYDKRKNKRDVLAPSEIGMFWEWAKGIFEQDEIDAMAWCFPASARIPFKGADGNYWVQPGQVVFIRRGMYQR